MTILNTQPSCAIYARVSTEDQKCALQLDELRTYIERRGWVLYAEYVDTGWSGAKSSRPQLDKLMKDASLHRFDTVLCWKLDRFGRSVTNLLEKLDALKRYGVRFLVTTQQVDTDDSNPASRLTLQILAAVAEFERSMIQERVKAGLAAAQRRGVRLGRPKRVIDRQKVLELHLRGKTIRQISKQLECSLGTVHSLLPHQAKAAS